MTDTWDDIARDNALAELHDEAIMARAAQEQAILIFVEGDSEEVALPILFTDLLDFDAVGVKIANYSGNGSLVAFVRLMTVTLGHRYPIIITHDNDPDSIAAVDKCRRQKLLNDRAFMFPIPDSPVVKYSSGHGGGSFEEAFSPEAFLEAAFSDEILPAQLLGRRNEFEAQFDRNSPWLAQLQRFSAAFGFTEWSTRKPVLAQRLAEASDDLPPTFSRLLNLINEVRKRFPIFHPSDVELPYVPGLTERPKPDSR